MFKSLLRLFLLTGVAAICSSATAQIINGIHYVVANDTATVVALPISEGGYAPEPYVGEVIIPASIEVDGKTIPVSHIGDYAFKSCKQVTKIELPEGILTLGKESIARCDGLKEIHLPSTLQRIESMAFQTNKNLVRIDIPASVEWIAPLAFSRCPKLTAIKVSAANKYFTDMDGVLFSADGKCLKQVPSGFAFTQTENTGHYLVPAGVERVEEEAFGSCSKLVNVELQEGVTEIAGFAFRNCTKLVKTILPSTVASIGEQAWFNCTSLKHIDCAAAVAPIAPTNIFTRVSNTVTLCVTASATGYDVEPWTTCTLDRTLLPTSVSRVRLSDDSSTEVYDLSGRRMSTARGICIVNGKKVVR